MVMILIVMIQLMVIVDGGCDIVVDDDAIIKMMIMITYLSTQCSTCDKRKEWYLSHTSTAMNMLHDGLEGGRSIICNHACKIYNDGDDDR
jgi:hypothetical protein